MIWNFFNLRALAFLLALAFLVCGAQHGLAQTTTPTGTTIQSVTVTDPSGEINEGTLQYTLTTTRNSCGSTGMYFMSWAYSSFYYILDGVSHSLSGSQDLIYTSTPTGSCPPINHINEPVSLTVPANIVPNCTITADPVYNPSTGLSMTATSACLSSQIYINPKYIIMGVTYAPPGGSSSSVSYQNTGIVGNTTTNSSSFSSGTTYSESLGVTATMKTDSLLWGFMSGISVTASQSEAWTQQSNASNTVTMNLQNSSQMKTTGVPYIYSPVDHDYDIIWLWLNPVVLFTIPPTNGGGSVVWNGYGYDYNDPVHDMDVWGVYVGYLNGDFGPMDSQDLDALGRGWITTQVFGPGDSAAITAADYPNILAADPFANNVSDQNSGYQVELAPGSSPATTTDGRFTQVEATTLNANGQAVTSPEPSIDYKQAPPDSTSGIQTTYANQYTNIVANATGSQSTAQTTYGLETKFTEEAKAGFLGDGATLKFTEDLKQNWTYTSVNTTLNTLTNTNTQTNTAVIAGPPCAATTAPCVPQYTEPHEFTIYQDNRYGTFMFWPNPFFSVGAVGANNQTLTPAAPKAIAAGQSVSYTIPTSANAGYSGTLNSFTVTGLPAGATYAVTPASGAAGTTFTLTVVTSASATPAGTSNLAVGVSDGSLRQFAYGTLTVSPSPSFTVTVSPSTSTISVGSSAVYELTTTVANGFDGVVNLMVDGLPSNCSASFSPETITGAGSSTLTIVTNGNTVPGTYQLSFTATSGSLTVNSTAMLVVTGQNFTLSASPEIQSINAGGSAVYSVTCTPLSGFSGSVTLSLSSLPTGATASFSPAAMACGGSSTLTITTTTSTPASTSKPYQLSVTGISGSLVNTAPVDLEVNN